MQPETTDSIDVTSKSDASKNSTYLFKILLICVVEHDIVIHVFVSGNYYH